MSTSLTLLVEKKITIYKLISDDDSNWELNIEYDLSVITSSRIVDMVASQDHALLLDETGKVYSYGISSKFYISFVNKCTAFGALGRTTKNIWGVVDISEKVKQIAVGRLFSFCLVNSRTIYAFGSNSYNQV
jgi:alpha-tubulin suppressor-like RCC1 family protein